MKSLLLNLAIAVIFPFAALAFTLMEVACNIKESINNKHDFETIGGSYYEN